MATNGDSAATNARFSQLADKVNEAQTKIKTAVNVSRDQLQAQQRSQQLQLYQGGIDQGGMGQGTIIGVPNASGPLRPFANPGAAASNLYQTQRELGRVNGLLNSSRTTQMLTVPPIMVVKPFKAP